MDAENRTRIIASLLAAAEGVRLIRDDPDLFDLRAYAAEIMAHGYAILAECGGHTPSIEEARAGVGSLYAAFMREHAANLARLQTTQPPSARIN